MLKSIFKQLLVLAVAFSIVAGQVTWALAGTTGSLNGQILDATAGTPVSNAHVTVSSPSQTVNTTTDATGHFSVVSLAPDTYTIAVSKEGYEPTSIAGVSIFADQGQTVEIKTPKALKEIGRVTSRSAGALVRPGSTADVYSVSAREQSAVAALGGGGGLNNAFSAVASVPGVFVPQGQTGAYQSVFVRGGNYTQLGYEYDGVPIQRAFDQYPGGNLSNLGQQELQVYTGAPPVTTGSTALAGFINQVIRTGSYPGSGTIKLGVGAPVFYHQFQTEAGGATPSRLFSYYVGLNGYDQDFKFEESNAFSNTWGGVVNELRANCYGNNPTAGCYRNGSLSGGKLGPQGILQGPLFWGSTSHIADRDLVANFHVGIPHRKDQGRDDIQVLYNNTYLRTMFNSSLQDFGFHGPDLVNGTWTNPDGSVTPTCTPALTAAGTPCTVFGGTPLNFADKVVYTGPTGMPLGAADLANTSPYFFPGSSQQRTLGAAIPATERDSYQQNAAIVKLQYQHNIGSNAFLRVLGYTAYSDWLQYGPGGLFPNFYGSISQDYKLGAHTRGVEANYTNQFSPKHLFNATASYTTATTFRNNASVLLSGSTTSSGSGSDSSTIAFLVDSTNPTNGQCYAVAGAVVTPTSCALAATARYILPGTVSPLVTAHPGDPTVATAGSLTCGGGPCQYFTVNQGISSVLNTVTPKFSALAMQDAWKPSDKLLITLGLRYDDFKYSLLPTDGGAARQFWVNWYNRNNCLDPAQTNAPVTNAAPGTACGSVPANAGLLPVNFTAHSNPTNDYPVWQPRIGATLTLNPTNVLRFSYGKYAQPASSAFQQYDTSNPNLVTFNSTFFSNGYLAPSHVVYPEVSYNLDASWQHQAKGSDFSFAVTPYLRKTSNELITVLLDPKTSFVSGINVGKKTVSGVELAVQKGNLAQNGLFAKLSYTYTHATIKYTALPNGSTVVDGLNNAVRGYNSYTSFCATNPTDTRCPANPATTAANAAPCFTATGSAGTTGAANATCTAAPGTTVIANPYYNAPVRPLFNPNDSYAVYSQLSGNNLFSGSSGSYIVPHVLAFVLNYKHDKLNITPSMQLQAGGVYGRPLDVAGVNPKSCYSAPLAAGGPVVPATLGGSPTGDPRYPYGAAGGAPYNAASCSGSVPIPDPFTGNFDNYGAFKEPTKWSANLAVSYDVSPRVTISALAVNVLTGCGGGQQLPWTVGGKAGCVYGGSSYVSNFYNPGDTAQQGYKYPYRPVFGNVFQSSSGGQANPLQFYINAVIKM